MKILTVLFIILLVLIILAANLGLGPVLFTFLDGIPGGDKLGHFVLMGILSFLVNYLLGGKRIHIRSIHIPTGTAIVMAIVTLEEISQIFLEHRGFSLGDLFFDYAGIIIFGYLAEFLHRRRNLQQSTQPE